MFCPRMMCVALKQEVKPPKSTLKNLLALGGPSSLRVLDLKFRHWQATMPLKRRSLSYTQNASYRKQRTYTDKGIFRKRCSPFIAGCKIVRSKTCLNSSKLRTLDILASQIHRDMLIPDQIWGKVPRNASTSPILLLRWCCTMLVYGRKKEHRKVGTYRYKPYADITEPLTTRLRHA